MRVILAARLQLPFSRRLAWPTFSVRIAEAEALADPIGIVRKVPPPARAPDSRGPRRLPRHSPAPPRTRGVWPLYRPYRTDDADCACSTDRAYRAH